MHCALEPILLGPTLFGNRVIFKGLSFCTKEFKQLVKFFQLGGLLLDKRLLQLWQPGKDRIQVLIEQFFTTAHPDRVCVSRGELANEDRWVSWVVLFPQVNFLIF